MCLDHSKRSQVVFLHLLVARTKLLQRTEAGTVAVCSVKWSFDVFKDIKDYGLIMINVNLNIIQHLEYFLLIIPESYALDWLEYLVKFKLWI